jgi:hypothetical protein
VNRLHKISPSDSILLLILLVLLSFSLLPLLFGNCGKTWLALQIGFAAASARLEMSRAEAMHNIASSLALPSPLAVPLPLSMLLSFSLSLDMLRKRSEGLVDGRDEPQPDVWLSGTRRNRKTKRDDLVYGQTPRPNIYEKYKRDKPWTGD